MKIYFEARIALDSQEENADLLVAKLSAMGFDGFVEENEHLLAYREKINETMTGLSDLMSSNGITGSEIKEIPDQNWNAVWESQYEPVLIGDHIMVRAPFHEHIDGIGYDIVIEPRMSFGTAHHETTAMMLSLVYDLDCSGKAVLDMGCGTAVLAILAHKKGARKVLAVDNDEWAYLNALDNVKINNTREIEVKLDDAASIAGKNFDIILANINRNILLGDIPAYANALQQDGLLLMSGFYEEDLEQIRKKCLSSGLSYVRHMTMNRWAAAIFNK